MNEFTPKKVPAINPNKSWEKSMRIEKRPWNAMYDLIDLELRRLPKTTKQVKAQ